MANFDSSQWYHLYVNENKDGAMLGTNLYNASGTRGAVFFQPTNTTVGNQRWQIYAINSTFYVLRTREGGPDAFLGTTFSANEDTLGQTRASMIRGNVSDDSIYWRFSPWGDGTFFMTNKANKTAWHLERKKSDGLLAMDSNVTEPQNGQRFSWETIADIKMNAFSTVDLPSATVTSPATITPTSSGSSPNPPSDSGSGGLSAGAKAGIGAGVGVVALVALVVVGLFLWRRRKPKHDPGTELLASTHYEAPPQQDLVKYEMYSDNAAKHEMPVQQYAELPPNQAPAELPSSPVAHNAR